MNKARTIARRHRSAPKIEGHHREYTTFGNDDFWCPRCEDYSGISKSPHPQDPLAVLIRCAKCQKRLSSAWKAGL